MDTKHIHCMLEDMAEYGKCMIESATGSGSVNLEDAKKIVEMVGELAEAEYHALIAKEMRKSNEEDEAEEKYIRKMLKDEHKDEYKRYMDEYGEDGERRFYDNYRYKSSGRFAPKGRGSYMPRRGYDEPPYYHMNPDDYKSHDAEWYRDMDRASRNVMYYTPMGGDTGTNTHVATSTGNNGNVRGYSDGYADGMKDGRKSGESRYDRARRGYEEKKEMHKSNTPEDKQAKMRELEKYTKELAEDVTEMISDATPEERNLLRQKMQMMIQKIPQ